MSPKSKILRNERRQSRRPRPTKSNMLRRSLIAFGIILVGVSGSLAKKEPAVPPAAGQRQHLALVRLNVTGHGYDDFRPSQKKAPVSKRALGAVLSKG